MKVIDGMHRLMAASLQGRATINVIFFDGNEADVFLRAVEENVAHGLPLSQADRRSAAERIIESHPQMSDRAIGLSTGLAAKTVAAVRRRSADDIPQLSARVGRDGKVRPLDSGAGRRRAAEILAEQPEASLRDVAKVAGISPATVLDVRKRLERGESPLPAQSMAHQPGNGAAGSGEESTRVDNDTANPAEGKSSTAPLRPVSHGALLGAAATGEKSPQTTNTVEKLLRDPSLRNSENGRQMLRLLHVTASRADLLPGMAATLPPHCVPMVAQVADQLSHLWQTFATELNRRARVIDPAGEHNRG